MKRFAYGFDPLCLLACACYAANRWLVPPTFKGVFLHGYFSDTLFIPAALPLILWLQRRLGLRRTDVRPLWSEIFMHVAVWSVAAEAVAPHLFARATGDPWDVVAYTGGALVAGLVWHLG